MGGLESDTIGGFDGMIARQLTSDSAEDFGIYKSTRKYYDESGHRTMWL